MSFAIEDSYSKRYYRKNREKLLNYVKEKTRCDCGCVVARISLAKHRRTKKHENRLKHYQFLEDLNVC